MNRYLRWFPRCVIGLALAHLCNACAPDPQLTMSLTVTGLTGDLSVIINRGIFPGDTLSFTADSTKTFTTLLDSADLYSFSVTSPTGQTCTVENAAGYIDSNTTLRVLCAATASLRTVTGVVNGLASGQQILLGLNNGQAQLLGAGAFSFSSLPDGYQYDFSVLVDGPGKRCTISESEGTISGNIRRLISCQDVTIVYTDGKQYTGNLGGRSGADAKCATMTASMGAHFTCDVNKAFLSISASDQIANFPAQYSVRSDPPAYAYDATNSGGEIRFADNWSSVTANSAGYYQTLFTNHVWTGSNNDGTADSSCGGFTSKAGPGTVMYHGALRGTLRGCSENAELTCVCMHQHYQVGGSMSGLTAGESVQVQITYGNHQTDTLTLVDDGSFYSNQDLSAGESYSATILSAPTDASCAMTGNTSGTAGTTSVSALTITCAGPWVIGGTVSGLTGTVVLSLNSGAQTVSVTADGSFSFGTELQDGATYSVAVGTQPSGQVCTVTNGSGTITANVTNIAVTCETPQTYSIGGTVSGLTGTVVLSLNSGAQTVSVTADGSFSFGTELQDGATYSVAVGTQPSGQVCTVTNGSGTATANVTNITVTCETVTLSSIAITPTSTTIAFFYISPNTQQYTAIGTYSDNSTVDITSAVTWNSSNTAKATINAAGLATAVGSGSAQITATLNSVTSNAATMTIGP